MNDPVPQLPAAALHILIVLASGERHGYGIMADIEELTGGRVRMGPGTLYGAIKKLLADRLIEESDERPDPSLDDQRRRYYRVTGEGNRVCRAEVERLGSLVDGARARLPRLSGA